MHVKKLLAPFASSLTMVAARRIPKASFIVLASLLLAGSASGFVKTNYVATNGSDSNAGTQANPWLTMGKAIRSDTASDVLVYMRGGTYPKQSTTNVARSAMITFQAFPGELVTNTFKFQQLTNVRVEAMCLVEDNVVISSRNIQIVNNKVTALDHECFHLSAVVDSLIQSNYVHDVNSALRHYYVECAGIVVQGDYAGQWYGYCSNLTIAGNVLTNFCESQIIDLVNCQNSLVYSNFCLYLWHLGGGSNHLDSLHIVDAKNITVANNTMRTKPFAPARCILGQAEVGGGGLGPLTGLVFSNNVLCAGWQNIDLQECDGAVIADNTLWSDFDGSTTPGQQYGLYLLGTNNIVVNNVIRTFGSYGTYLYRSNNVIANIYNNTNLFPNETLAWATFVDTNAMDWHLTTSSPGRNAGTTNFAYFPRYDHDGYQRDSTPDLGALETVGGGGNLSTITIVATTSQASQNPLTNGVFTVMRTPPTTNALTVYYSLGGTALNGTDYTNLSGQVSIATGATSATITVSPLSDPDATNTLTVIATMQANANYTVGSPSSDTVYIAEPAGSGGGGGGAGDGNGIFTETFDTGSSASVDGWAGYQNTVNGNNFGFSNTHNNTFLDSTAGEAGGAIAWTTTNSFYGDTNLGGSFTLADTLHAEGELAITTSVTNLNMNMIIGFFNSTSAGFTTRSNALGLSIQEPAVSNYYRFKGVYVLGNGTDLEGAYMSLTNRNSSYKFSFDYNPTNGANGQGRLSLTMYDNHTNLIGTVNNDLTAANRATGATFDSFGLLTGGISQGVPSDTITLYIDNVSYTSSNNITPSTVTIAATTPNASYSPTTNGIFTVTRTSPTTGDLTVYYSLDGTAISGTDYTNLSGSVVIASGSSNATITVSPLSDTNLHGTVTVLATLSANSNYNVGSPSTDTVYIGEPANGGLMAEFFYTSGAVSADGWVGYQNTVNGNNFGFSNTHNDMFSDSTAAEAGGVIARTATNTYYADTNLGGPFSLANTLHADGELAITGSANLNNSVGIGFLNHTNAGGTTRKNVLAFSVQEPAISNYYRAKAVFMLGNGTDLEGSALNLTNVNSSYKFSFDYTPTGGVNGQGRLALQLFDNAGQTIGTLNNDLTSGNRTTGASFDSFGIFSGGEGAPASTNTITVYIDNVTYTVGSGVHTHIANPPPADIVLSAVVAGKTLRITWDGRAGLTYRLESSTDLREWQEVMTTNNNTDGVIRYDDPALRVVPSRFYRVVLP